MPKIYRLDDIEINQIAAGEVIENPASIVKELLENSLDAGAEEIRIEILKGGQELIEIEDDGCGMEKEDALLCLERHATSKIKKAEDLQRLTTLGFRGEALAAIAAVSHLQLTTSIDSLGIKLLSQGGILEKVEPFARNRGTTIRVGHLFFNAPARKKFLKSISACTQQIVKVVEIAALAHPKVAFFLTSDKKTIFSLERQEQRQRIETLLGPFKEEISKPGIWGLLASSEEAKVQRRGQYLFVNRRPVFSPFISKAVQLGYGTRLMEGLYPPFVLFLDLLPKEIDVNVHPQKKEVRFSDEKKVFHLVERAVSDAFNDAPSFSSSLSFEEPLLRESCSFPIHPFQVQSERYVEKEFPLSFAERPLWVGGGFLILEKGGLFLVDLARARARVLFDCLKNKGRPQKSLPYPLEIAIDHEEEALFELEKIGVEARLIGKKRIAVDSLPEEFDLKEFPEFFSFLRQMKKVEAAVTECCRRGKKHYSLDEALFLWNRLMKSSEIKVDPQGEKIWKELQPEDFALWLR